MTFCAALAWNFHERSAMIEFRSVGASTTLGPASENIFAILRHLALVQPVAPNSQPELLSQLAADPESFKIIVTSQPRGSIPSELWNTSYIVFASDLSS